MSLRLDRSRWQPGAFISYPTFGPDGAMTFHGMPIDCETRELVRISDEVILKAAFESLVEMIKRKEGQ